MKDIRVLLYPIARVLGDNQQVMNSSCLRGISLIIFEHIKKLLTVLWISTYPTYLTYWPYS